MSGFVLNSYVLNTGYFDSKTIFAENTEISPTVAAANVTFNTNGTGTAQGDSTLSFSWWSSTVTGIGAGKYATAIVSGETGTATITGDIPTNGSRVEWNVARSIGISKSAVGTATKQFTVNVYDQPTGGNLIGTIVFDATTIVSSVSTIITTSTSTSTSEYTNEPF